MFNENVPMRMFKTSAWKVTLIANTLTNIIRPMMDEVCSMHGMKKMRLDYAISVGDPERTAKLRRP